MQAQSLTPMSRSPPLVESWWLVFLLALGFLGWAGFFYIGTGGPPAVEESRDRTIFIPA
jgi:hypothetical protein